MEIGNFVEFIYLDQDDWEIRIGNDIFLVHGPGDANVFDLLAEIIDGKEEVTL